MFTSTIDFKLRIGSVIKVKEECHGMPVGTYIVHLITTSISNPDMLQSNDKEYFFENVDNHFRDYSLSEEQLNDPNIEILNSKVDLYKVEYKELRDAETDAIRDDLVYVLHGTEPSAEYFNKRIEASYDYYPNAIESIKMRDVSTKSWTLLKENF